LGPYRSTPGSIFWRCRCESKIRKKPYCGKIKWVPNSGLVDGETTRCKDCGAVSGGNKRRSEKGAAGFRKLLRRVQNNAKVKKQVFDLDLETFKKLTKGNCYYCGEKPKQIATYWSPAITKKTKLHSAYVHNGIDRVNNSLGYIKGNCVSCCVFCNRAKTTHTRRYFLAKIRQIYKNSCRKSK